MNNLENKINSKIENFQKINNAKIGDKFKMRSNKRVDTIEIIDIAINLNAKFEINRISFIAKKYASGLLNEMIFELCRSTLKLRCQKI